MWNLCEKLDQKKNKDNKWNLEVDKQTGERAYHETN